MSERKTTYQTIHMTPHCDDDDCPELATVKETVSWFVGERKIKQVLNYCDKHDPRKEPSNAPS